MKKKLVPLIGSWCGGYFDRRVLYAVFGAGQRGECWRGVFHVRRERYYPLRRLALAFTL